MRYVKAKPFDNSFDMQAKYFLPHLNEPFIITDGVLDIPKKYVDFYSNSITRVTNVLRIRRSYFRSLAVGYSNVFSNYTNQ